MQPPVAEAKSLAVEGSCRGGRVVIRPVRQPVAFAVEFENG
jgi:hypothetical protein